jgi:hypothetical protein
VCTAIRTSRASERKGSTPQETAALRADRVDYGSATKTGYRSSIRDVLFLPLLSAHGLVRDGINDITVLRALVEHSEVCTRPSSNSLNCDPGAYPPADRVDRPAQRSRRRGRAEGYQQTTRAAVLQGAAAPQRVGAARHATGAALIQIRQRRSSNRLTMIEDR